MSEQLNVVQRQVVYKQVQNELLEWIHSGNRGDFFLCPELMVAAKKLGYITFAYGSSSRAYKLFPEFARRKPWFVDKRNAWWKGADANAKRFRALEKAIKSTERQLKYVLL
jgi:hypothetical protein